ncbi:MAG: flagellin [Gammaproteobacteria bacterium]
MAQYINTNVASLNAQRNLNKSGSAMATSMQRLSTGLRINSAKDDAAGMAISERFTSQIRGLDQAMRNANDGISLAQTAEGALGELTNNLQRIRELAVQSANVTNSNSDRAALDAEVQQRIAEIDRIATQTSFNGLNVLDGSAGSASFQVGANVGETINLGLSTNARSGALGQIATAQGQTTNAAFSGGMTISVGDNDPVAIGSTDGDTSAKAKTEAINSAGVPGLTATVTNSVTASFTSVTTSTGADDNYDLTINGTAVITGDVSDGDITGAFVAEQINLFASETGVTATFDAANDELTMVAQDGRNIVAIEDIGADVTGAGFAAAFADADGETSVGQITLSASDNITLAGTAADITASGLASSIAKDAQTLDNVAINDVAGANDAISRIDSALQAVSGFRSDLGAIQNRLESTIVNLQTTNENLSAARGRIQDTDFASETASLTKSQILQQAGVAMLSQANSQPQVALSLLG